VADNDDIEERYDVSVKDLDYVDPVDTDTRGDDVADMLDGQREAAVGRVKDRIERVKEEIGERECIEEEALEQLYDEIQAKQQRLNKLSVEVPDQEERAVEERRLRDSLSDLYEQVRSVREGSFRNKKELREELRGLERELEEVLDSEDVVNQLLDHGQ